MCDLLQEIFNDLLILSSNEIEEIQSAWYDTNWSHNKFCDFRKAHNIRISSIIHKLWQVKWIWNSMEDWLILRRNFLINIGMERNYKKYKSHFKCKINKFL